MTAFIGVAAQDDDPIRVDSSIVRLNVGVVDKRGRPITDLAQGSFEIYEDGVKQQISRFEPSDAPFSVVIMLDMSGSTLGFRQVLKQSAFRFIDALSPNDRVFVRFLLNPLGSGEIIADGVSNEARSVGSARLPSSREPVDAGQHILVDSDRNSLHIADCITTARLE